MDLSLTPAQVMMREAARGFVDRECARARVRELEESESGFAPDLWKTMAQMGWTGMLIPEEYGGLASSLTDAAVICQELGRSTLISPFLSTAVLAALIITRGGTKSQKQHLLPKIASGEMIVALALTEPGYGWAAQSVQLRAEAHRGGFVLNGTKLFVHDAHIADQIICVARNR